MNKPDQALLQYFNGKDILQMDQFNRLQIEAVLQTAAYYEQKLKNKERLYDMDGKLMASLFFEPSTRTRLSFESAMHRLGGNVVTVSEAPGLQFSSRSKGESIADSIKVISSYCDVLVCRSSEDGTRHVVADNSSVPVINAGDGAGQHPSQSFLDMYCIFKEKGSPDGKTVAMLGDLKYGRTIHSLSQALSHYDTKIIYSSVPGLEMPLDQLNQLKKAGVNYEETYNMEYAVKNSDIIYMTRVQKERFDTLAEYQEANKKLSFTAEYLQIMREGAIIMHPLPRAGELDEALDCYPGAAYFRQAAGGLPVRMALLALVCGVAKINSI
ncbi:MAG: aspartate carbamoyltransferase [Clostridia bacterium]|nr:aspartate carbamoyltransferase [Clostridia bacterium]